MKVVSKAGKYFVSSTGQTETCGIYMVANADEVVEVEVEVLDVSCENQGLVVVSHDFPGKMLSIKKRQNCSHCRWRTGCVFEKQFWEKSSS